MEKWVASAFAALGWKHSRRQPGSGIYDSFPHDNVATFKEKQYIIECKARKEPHKTLERWLGAADILVVRADRGEPHVYLPWRVWAQIAFEEEEDV